MTLGRGYRLRGRKSFAQVKKEGRLIRGPLFSLLILKKEGEAGPRFGFVVSKRIDKRAVERNRIRRLLARAAREVLPEVRENVQIVFLAKKSLKEADFKEVLGSLRRKLGEYAEKRQT